MIDLSDHATSKLSDQINQVDLIRKFAMDRWQEYDLVFPSRVGTPKAYNVVVLEFKALAKKVGLREVRL